MHSWDYYRLSLADSEHTLNMKLSQKPSQDLIIQQTVNKISFVWELKQ